MNVNNESNKIEGLTYGNGRRNKSKLKKVKRLRRVNDSRNIIDKVIDRCSYFLELQFKYDIVKKIGIKTEKNIQKFWDIFFGIILTIIIFINIIVLSIFKFKNSINFLPKDITNIIDKSFILENLLPITIFLISITFMLWVDLEEEEEI